jgi:hypothetical protein
MGNSDSDLGGRGAFNFGRGVRTKLTAPKNCGGGASRPPPVPIRSNIPNMSSSTPSPFLPADQAIEYLHNVYNERFEWIKRTAETMIADPRIQAGEFVRFSAKTRSNIHQAKKQHSLLGEYLIIRGYAMGDEKFKQVGDETKISFRMVKFPSDYTPPQ